jgi:hypothetical protein
MTPEPWRCWRCGGLHAAHHQRCPRAGVNLEGAPTREKMQARLDAFLQRNADKEKQT